MKWLLFVVIFILSASASASLCTGNVVDSCDTIKDEQRCFDSYVCTYYQEKVQACYECIYTNSPGPGHCVLNAKEICNPKQ